MRFKCEFPGKDGRGCDFETNNKSQINEHHMVPKEAGGPNDKWNRITLCATHHNGFIYCPESRFGVHSIKHEDSIILKGWKSGSDGKVLEYIDCDGETKYYKPRV